MSRYNIVSTVFLTLFIGSLAVDGSWSIPLAWYVMLFAVYAVISIAGAVVLSLQYFFPVRTGNRERDGVAITYRGRIRPGVMEKILMVLKKCDVQATFFCTGDYCNESQVLIKRVAEEGHLVANHGNGHEKTFFLHSSAMIVKTLAYTDSVIASITGKRPKFFQPPLGLTSPMLAKAVRRRNYVVIGWHQRFMDTVLQDDTRLQDAVTKIKRGGIILFDEPSDRHPEYLPSFLDALNKRGIISERLDVLLKEKGYG